MSEKIQNKTFLDDLSVIQGLYGAINSLRNHPFKNKDHQQMASIHISDIERAIDSLRHEMIETHGIRV